MGVQSPVLTSQVKPEAHFFFFLKEGISLSEWCYLLNLNSGINILLIFFFFSHGSQLWEYTILAATLSVDPSHQMLRPGENSTVCLGVSGLGLSLHLHLSICLWMSPLPSLDFQFLWVVNFHCTGLWETPWSRAHVCAGAWRIVGPPRTYVSALSFLFPLQREQGVLPGLTNQDNFSGS